MPFEQTTAYATETFWEYIRGNLSANQAVAELDAMAVTTTPEQLREARMRDVECGAWSRAHDRAFLMRQPC